jgi:hypothetical protein
VYAVDLNDHGAAVLRVVNRSHVQHVVWREGLPAVEVPLHAAECINNSGVVGGQVQGQVATWDPVNGVRRLPFSDPYSEALDINSAGWVVGSRVRPHYGMNVEYATVWGPDGSYREFSPGFTYGNPAARAIAINDHNLVLFWRRGGESPIATFVWHKKVGFLEVPPKVGYRWGVNGTGLNQHGQVCAISGDAVVWDKENGTRVLPPFNFHSVAAVPKACTISPVAINDEGSVVGIASLIYINFLVVYLQGAWYRLVDIVEGNLGPWQLQSAVAINNRGQILGNARDVRGSTCAFLATPLD